jgi:hypothetical protein
VKHGCGAPHDDKKLKHEGHRSIRLIFIHGKVQRRSKKTDQQSLYSSISHGGGKQRDDVIANHQSAVGNPGAASPPLVMRLPFQFSSASRRTAAALGFLIFSQWLTRPLRQAEPRRFDTIPSHPSEHACRKDDRAVAVEVLLKAMPSPASRRRVASVSFRSSSRAQRRSSPSSAIISKAQSTARGREADTGARRISRGRVRRLRWPRRPRHMIAPADSRSRRRSSGKRAVKS